MVRFLVSDAADAHDTDSVWSVYEAVFGDFSDQDTWRATVWDKHTARNGFRMATAYEGEVLVGSPMATPATGASGGLTTRFGP